MTSVDDITPSDAIDALARQGVDRIGLNRLVSEAFASSQDAPPSDELPWRTLEELILDADVTVDWIALGIAAAGAITLLTAKPKVGKSTFTRSLVRNVLAGGRFLGESTRQVPVSYLSEEGAPAFLDGAARVGLTGSGNLRILMRSATRSRTLAEIVEALLEEPPGLLIVDTGGAWLGLKGDEEKTAPVPPPRRWCRYRRPQRPGLRSSCSGMSARAAAM